MSRSTKAFIVCVVAAAHAALLQPQSSFAQTASPQISADVQAACASDAQNLCSGVPAGGGRIIACLKQHKDEVSDGCKRAILAAMGRSSGDAGSAASPAPTAASPAPPPVEHHGEASSTANTPSSSPSKQKSPASPTTSAVSGEHYFLMKQVKIIDQGSGQGRPAYDLMIPTTWQFKGSVNVHEAEGGCYADWFSVFGDATSPDNSVELQIAPQFTWQYMDDPAGQRQMQAQNQKDAQSGMKPCPVRAPIKAEEFLRQDVAAKHFKNGTVVSVEAFPELDQIVRHRLGLPPQAAGDSAGTIRTDAARMHLAYDDKGQPVESWVSAVIVVRTIPTGGRGTAYDWHAINVLFFRAPKGKLDANDKLFKLMASTIRPEPEWQKWSNGIIAGLYQKKHEELAKQGAMIAQFQMHVADVVNGVTANSQAGANRAAFGQDQLVRGVQTFRDPATGGMFELSNQYDHAWLNSANEYVMSDDPNFNPNGNLSGNWNQLEVVRPQP